MPSVLLSPAGEQAALVNTRNRRQVAGRSGCRDLERSLRITPRPEEFLPDARPLYFGLDACIAPAGLMRPLVFLRGDMPKPSGSFWRAWQDALFNFLAEVLDEADGFADVFLARAVVQDAKT